MLKIKRIFGVLLLATLVACSSGGDDESFGDTTPPEDPVVVDPTEPVIPDAASIDALTSNPQLQSDGGIPVTISALVKDENNNFIEGATVVFRSDTGSLQPVNLVTGADGTASALLTTAGEPQNRVITVTATTGESTDNVLTDTVTVTVIGTDLQITGPVSLAQGATATYTLVLNNADGTGIEGETVNDLFIFRKYIIFPNADHRQCWSSPV